MPTSGLVIGAREQPRMGLWVADEHGVLNRYNQAYDVPDLVVTDGARMTSSACQNPSITYMALTARVADYAVQEMKCRNI